MSADSGMIAMRMCTNAVLAVAVLFIVGVWIFLYARSQSSSDLPMPVPHASVVLTEKGFEPETVSVNLHGTVTFSTNRYKPFWPASNLHPTHGIYPEFDPRRSLSTEESWTFQFDKVGEWKYHDHLRSYFTGIIYVVE